SILAVLLCSCHDVTAPGGPPPPPTVPARHFRLAAFRLGGTTEFEEIPVEALREGLKLYRFTEGAYYALETVDLGGDAGALTARVDEAVQRGADLVVVTHPFLLRTLTGHPAGRPVVFGILGDPLALGAGQADDRHAASITGSYNPLHAYSTLALARY